MAETDAIDQVTEDMGEIKADIRQIDGRLSRLDEKANGLESRLSRLEGLVEQMDRRLTNLEQTMRQMMESQSSAQRWIIGIILGTWLTTILTILLKAG